MTSGPESVAGARWYHAVVLLVVGVVVWHVTATYDRLSHTVDSPVHITAGMEWLQHGSHRIHAENPPLARVAVGLGPHLRGHQLPDSGTAYQRGTEVLYMGGDYAGNLLSARLGQLPFFLLGIFLVWRWAASLAGARAACLAAVTFCTLPPVIGHAGLATTDVTFLTMFTLAMMTFVSWLQAPTGKRAIVMGLGVGLALAPKYSTLVFFPPAVLVTLLLWGLTRRRDVPVPWRAWLLGGVAVAVLSSLVVWAAFRFDVGKLDDNPKAAQVIAQCFPDEDSAGRRVAEWVAETNVPAPDGVFGFLVLYAHTKMGHPAYALGGKSQRGFWYFYPLAVLVKTPLAFLLLLLAATLFVARRARSFGWRYLCPVAAGCAILVSLMGSSICIGLRHGLAVYPMFAVGLGLGVDAWIRGAGGARRVVVVAVTALVLWLIALVPRAFPDYISWFNPAAGTEPGEVLVDSDLDWGQDAFQLRDYFDGRDVEELKIAYFGNVRICEIGLPPLRWLPPHEPTTGWLAVSEMYFRDHWHKVYEDPCDRWGGRYDRRPGGYSWLSEHEPVARAGRSIRIYHIPAR